MVYQKSNNNFSYTKLKGEGRDHLIIPDGHTYPGDSLDRYYWLSEFIMERQPSVIVNIGDHWDMNSLCSYDLGKKSHFQDKNLKDDLEIGHAAEKIIFDPIVKYNSTRSKWKKRQYNPLYVKCIGNHEFRLKRMLELQPQWEGIVGMEDFMSRYGDTFNEHIIDFLDFDIVDGVGYSHYFVSGVQGRPATSPAAMISKKAMSCTMGHTHTLDYSVMKKPTGELIRGAFAGSFHEKDHESFAGPQVDNIWWNGIIYKHNVINGDYDIEEWSVERLERIYNG